MAASTSLEEVLKLYLAAKLLSGGSSSTAAVGSSSGALQAIRSLLGDGSLSSGGDGNASGGGHGSDLLAGLRSAMAPPHGGGGKSSSSESQESSFASSSAHSGSDRSLLEDLSSLLDRHEGSSGSQSGKGGGDDSSSAPNTTSDGLLRRLRSLVSVSEGTSANSNGTESGTAAGGESESEGSKGDGRGSAGPSGEVTQFLSALMKKDIGGSPSSGSGASSGTSPVGSATQGAVAAEALILSQAKQEFSTALERNLKRLKDVVQESQEIVKKMELVLGQSSSQHDESGAQGSGGTSENRKRGAGGDGSAG